MVKKTATRRRLPLTFERDHRYQDRRVWGIYAGNQGIGQITASGAGYTYNTPGRVGTLPTLEDAKRRVRQVIGPSL